MNSIKTLKLVHIKKKKALKKRNDWDKASP